jgi:hypothetical protein
MRILARTFLLLLVTLPILAIAVVWLCFQDARRSCAAIEARVASRPLLR